jgi:UDP-N-acetylglucosamine 2-epimerase (non-hydrolysing)
VITAHRRESFGEGFERIRRALARIADRLDVQLVYVPFVDLMRRAYLLVTDSGVIQEEGPSLGKPILVLREKTERPEAHRRATARHTIGWRTLTIPMAMVTLANASPRQYIHS